MTFKSTYALLTIFLFLISKLYADCPTKLLYCFDENNKRIGNFTANQCWIWRRLSCQPCSADITTKEISFQRYIHHCRYYYPNSVLVLDRNQVWIHKVVNAFNDMVLGKRRI